MIGSPPSPQAAWLHAAAAADWWRGGPLRGEGPLEWMHFVVTGPDLRLLCNLSLRAEAGVVHGRVLALAWEGGGWRGGAELVERERVEVRPGRVDAFFGESSVRLTPEGYEVRLGGTRTGVDAELVLAPAAAPLAAGPLKLPDGGRFHWVCVPHLQVIRGRLGTRDLTGFAAYHDHNWGRFDFGGDYAWEWAFGLPAHPTGRHSFMAMRVADRARSRTLLAGLAVWRDGALWRDFRGAEVEYERAGRWRGSVHRTPSAVEGDSLLVGSVPASATWRARDTRDSLTVVGSVDGVAQVLIPAGPRVVRISECPTRVRATGTLRGERIDDELIGLLEVLDA